MVFRKGAVIAVPVVAAVACTALAGCGTTSENRGGAAQTQSVAKCQGTAGRYVIGMSQANVAEPYRQRMDDDIRAAAKAVPQFEVRFADAQQDNSRQVSNVEDFITQRVDLLVISPNEARPLTAVVKKAYDRGIPVLVLDRKVEGEAYTSFIGADNVDIGRQAGRYVAEQLLPGGGKVAEIRGLAGSTPARERGDGFREAIAGRGVEIVTSQDGDWLREKGQEKADVILKSHPDVQVVYAHNDPMAEGAHLAAKAVGRDTTMKFVGIDGLPIPSGGLKAVEAGRLSATLIYPTGGREAVETARRILVDCQQPPRVQTLPTQLVTKENAAEVYARANGG